MLVQRVDGVWSGRICRRRQDVRVLYDDYDVRGMTAASTLGMVRVDGPAIYGC